MKLPTNEIHRRNSRSYFPLWLQLEILIRGFGIESEKRHDLQVIAHWFPSLMTSLGFYGDGDGVLQWRKPEDEKEFVCLYLAIHGLFRPSNLQTLV